MYQGEIPPKAYQRSRSEGYLSKSKLDTVIGNDVKIGTIYFVNLEKLTKLVNESFS